MQHSLLDWRLTPSVLVRQWMFMCFSKCIHPRLEGATCMFGPCTISGEYSEFSLRETAADSSVMNLSLVHLRATEPLIIQNLSLLTFFLHLNTRCSFYKNRLFASHFAQRIGPVLNLHGFCSGPFWILHDAQEIQYLICSKR